MVTTYDFMTMGLWIRDLTNAFANTRLHDVGKQILALYGFTTWDYRYTLSRQLRIYELTVVDGETQLFLNIVILHIIQR